MTNTHQQILSKRKRLEMERTNDQKPLDKALMAVSTRQLHHAREADPPASPPFLSGEGEYHDWNAYLDSS